MKRFTLLLVILFITIHVSSIIVSCSLTPEQNASNYDSTRSSSTLKTSRTNYSRTIHRMSGGHVQYANGNIVDVHNDSLPIATTIPNAHFKRKTISSRYNASRIRKLVNNTSDAVVQNPSKYINWSDNNHLDDADFGLLTASAGNGKDDAGAPKKEESKKTLADQVAEGKYGLIQKELFSKEPKRPGIVSYVGNPEVPQDDAKNYGGLDIDDIWLAEDHLLVLKGGSLNTNSNREPWKPIDDYEAPRRQVQLPLNPKVPPPFPVQLTDNGPIQFIGNNQFPVFNPFTNESIFLFTNEGFPKAQADDNDKKNLFTGYGTAKNNTQHNGYQYPPPVPPPVFNNNQTFSNPFLNLPPLPPFPFPPTGSYDEQNNTDPFDEDDPSLYYPPPYSFKYKSNYTNPVSPGPLVPGIILPPPPSFFEPLDEEQKQVKTPLDVLNKIQNIKLREKLTTSTPRPTKASTTTSRRPEAKFVEIQRVKVKQFSPQNHDIRENIVLKPVPHTRFYSSTSSPRTRPTTTTTTTAAPTTTSTTTTIRPRTILKKIPTPPIISFVPKHTPAKDNFAKGNPVYYEYFEARTPQAPYPIYSSPITTPLPLDNPTTNEYIRQHKVVTQRPIFKQIISTPIYDEINFNNNPPSHTYLPIKNSDYDKYLYITPKPDIKPNGITNNFIPIANVQSLALKPLQTFEREIETIRQTLRYYGNPPENIPTQTHRAPKTKAVYEYSFDATQNNDNQDQQQYQQPVELDKTPFRPMVPYSLPLNTGYKNVPYKVLKEEVNTEPPTNYYQPTQQQPKAGKYLRTSTYRVPSSANLYYNHQPTTTNKPPQQYYDDYNYNSYGQKLPTQNVDHNQNMEYTSITTTRPVQKNQPWYSIEKHIVKEIRNPNPVYANQDYQYERPVIYNNGASGFNQNDAYVKQISQIKDQLTVNRYPSPPPQYAKVSNNSYARPFYNSEYDNSGYYPQRPQKQPSNKSQHKYSNQQQQSEIPLNKDILVNYKYPLPPINPDSELVPYNPPNYRRYLDNPIIQYRLPGDRAHVYFITPQELKYSNK